METKLDRYNVWYDDAAQELVEKKCVNGKYCLYSDVEKLLIKGLLGEVKSINSPFRRGK